MTEKINPMDRFVVRLKDFEVLSEKESEELIEKDRQQKMARLKAESEAKRKKA